MNKILLLSIVLTTIVLLGVGCENIDIKEQKDTIQKQQEQMEELTKQVEELTNTKTPEEENQVVTENNYNIPKNQNTPKVDIEIKQVEEQVNNGSEELVKIENKEIVDSDEDNKEDEAIDSIPEIKDPIIGENLKSKITVPSDIVTVEQTKSEYAEAKQKSRQLYADWTNGVASIEAYTQSLSELNNSLNKLENNVSRNENCKKLYGDFSYIDIRYVDACYCATGYVKDSLKGQCVTYEEYCRNSYGENAMYQNYNCLYCEPNYILQRSTSNPTCHLDKT